jgi:hypothetical protein
VPAQGGLVLRTSGRAPSLTPALPGDLTLTAAGLFLMLTPGDASAAPGPSPAPTSAGGADQGATAAPSTAAPAPSAAPTPSATPGTALGVSCALAKGQQVILATVPVTGGPARTPQRSTFAVTPQCPALPPGGLKFNPRFPLPKPPNVPGTVVGHSPAQGCAYTTGYADARKLNGAALIQPGLTNVELTVRTVVNFKPNVNFAEFDNIALLDFHGLQEFPPSTATFLTFGFVPTTASIELIEHGTINIFAIGPAIPNPCKPNRFQKCVTINTVYSRLSVKIVPGSVRVNGVPLNVGSDCQTPPFDAVLTGTSASNPPYSVQFGGPLTGMVSIPQFSNCGVGENLDPIFNAAISGPHNFNLLTQGAVCFVIGGFGCDPNTGKPVIPAPIHSVTG